MGFCDNKKYLTCADIHLISPDESILIEKTGNCLFNLELNPNYVSSTSGSSGTSGSGSDSSWSLLGNSGTNPAINFLGTIDNRALVLKSFNTEAFRFTSTLGSTNNRLRVQGMDIWTGLGSDANNNGFGENTLAAATTGEFNFASGRFSLENLTSGNANTGSGINSLNTLTTGSSNTSVGNNSGDLLTTGSQNVFVGAEAGANVSQKVDALNSIAIGYDSFTTKNNQAVLGNSSITETILRENVAIGPIVPTASLHVKGNSKFERVSLADTNARIQLINSANEPSTWFEHTGHLRFNWVELEGIANPPIVIAFGTAALNFPEFPAIYIQPGGTDQTGIIIRKIDSHSATMQKWEDDAGDTLSEINTNGGFATLDTVTIGALIGTETLEVNGTLKFVTGNESAGYILTSDGAGNADWAPAVNLGAISKAQFSGDGIATSFSIAHGLIGTPNAIVGAGSSAAAGFDYYTIDATNITVMYSVAPAPGVNNITLYWQANL